MQEDVYQGEGLNLYAYCGNNPVVYCDPSGYDSNATIKDVLDYFNQHSNNNPSGIFDTNNSWNSFRHIVGGQGFSDEQIAAAYNELLRTNTNGHYIHRNNLSNDLIDILKQQPVPGYGEKCYNDLIAENIHIQLDIGHQTDWEFWRTRNAAENLGWTQAQYDEFMTSELTKHYQYEEHSINISHVNENHSSDVSDIEVAMLDYQKKQEDNGNWERKEEQTNQNGQRSCGGGKK